MWLGWGGRLKVKRGRCSSIHFKFSSSPYPSSCAPCARVCPALFYWSLFCLQTGNFASAEISFPLLYPVLEVCSGPEVLPVESVVGSPVEWQPLAGAWLSSTFPRLPAVLPPCLHVYLHGSFLLLLSCIPNPFLASVSPRT